MSFSKKELAELLISIKGAKQDAVSERRWDYRELYKLIDAAREFVIAKAYFVAKKQDGDYNIPGEFISVFEADVKEDTLRKVFYTKLPASLVSLPGNRGLVQVCPIENDSESFIQTQPASDFIFNGLEAGNLSGRTSVKIEGKKLIYKNLQQGVDKVLVKMVAGTETLKENDPLPMPAEYKTEVMDKVLEWMSDKSTADKVADTSQNK